MDFDPVLDAARKLVDDGATPACQVAVAHDGEIVCFETFGAATNDTRFCVFSATKPIVASAVWILIGDGLLDPSRPVAHYIPEFATNGKEVVTVEQVMLHTSGFPNAPMDAVEGGDAVTRVKRFTEWRLEWEPGTRFEYHALVRALGARRADRTRERPRLPRLHRGTRLRAERSPAPPRAAARGTGRHRDRRRRSGRAPADSRSSSRRPARRSTGPRCAPRACPAAAAIMTAATMARFYQALLHDPNGVWDADVLHDAKTNVRCTFPDPLMNVAREPLARARARGRRRPAPVPLRHVRQGQLARQLRPRRRLLPGRVGRSRDRHLVLVPEERAAG